MIAAARRGSSTNTVPLPAASFSDRLWAILVAMPLLVAFLDPARVSYAILGVALAMAIRHVALRRAISGIDLLAILCSLIVLVSPLWRSLRTLDVSEVLSPSLGAGLGVVYLVIARWYIYGSRRRFLYLVFGAVIVALIISVNALTTGAFTTISGGGQRWFVEFANANFIGAALATSISFGVLILLQRKVAGSRVTVVTLFGLPLLITALYLTGSRASLAGVAIAVVGVVVFRRRFRLHRAVSSALLIACFLGGFFPTILTQVLAEVYEPLSGLATFARDASTLDDASGRLALWQGGLEAFRASPLFGWGPGVYGWRFTPGGIPAHAWGLEYLAATGILGTVALMALVIVCFRAPWMRLKRRKARGSSFSTIWNTTTAVALAPNLALSTHQWNVWAWLVIGLWSCASVLDTSGTNESEAAN